MKKYVDGVLMDMTEEDIIQYNEAQKLAPTELEILMMRLRVQRNSLLAETDWWGASDNTMTDAQKKYRQDLRDLTNGLDTVEKVNAVTFPTKP
jgi:hypothetical protein|tara:strand:+ start:238 stop:516 length:279 start_codon:yes stop_codon:yes gene_type:complete